MLSFSCDYNEGAHAKVLEKLIETNLIQAPGYGEDKFCESAKKKIRAACQCPQADVFFLVGGTQITPEIAVQMGADAGFGRGTKGIHDATFLVERRRELEAAGKWPR